MEGSDEISNLLEPILQHIMSFLIVEDAAKTSILSKRFRGLISLQVAGTLPKLRTVKLIFCPLRFQNVDIVAPNLRDLSLNSTSRELNLINVIACKTLTSLLAQRCCRYRRMGRAIFFLSAKHSNLLLNLLSVSSDHLKRLAAIVCDNFDAVDVDAPNLLLFNQHVHNGTKLKLKASHLLEAYLTMIAETL